MSTYGVLKHQHTSLQFSDPPRQQEHDVRKLFAKGEKFPIKTGTESGRDNALFDLVDHYAKKHNHIVHHGQGNWVAIDREIIKPKSRPKKDRIHVVRNDVLFGQQADREFPTIQFIHADPRMGVFGVAGFHYSTHGKLPHDPNYDTNMMYAGKIAKWMEEAARGTNIAIGAGDFNMVDKMPRQDWPSARDSPPWPMSSSATSRRAMVRSTDLSRSTRTSASRPSSTTCWPTTRCTCLPTTSCAEGPGPFGTSSSDLRRSHD